MQPYTDTLLQIKLMRWETTIQVNIEMEAITFKGGLKAKKRALIMKPF